MKKLLLLSIMITLFVSCQKDEYPVIPENDGFETGVVSNDVSDFVKMLEESNGVKRIGKVTSDQPLTKGAVVAPNPDKPWVYNIGESDKDFPFVINIEFHAAENYFTTTMLRYDTGVVCYESAKNTNIVTFMDDKNRIHYMLIDNNVKLRYYSNGMLYTMDLRMQCDWIWLSDTAEIIYFTNVY